MPPSAQPELPAAQRYDLRKVPVDDVLERVEKSLQLRLAADGAVHKRRSIGCRSDRGTWVRIECRGLERLDGQGWGLEAAGVMQGVRVPDWHAGVSWLDPDRRVMWRADETQLVEESPIKRASAAASLSQQWWTALDAALDAVAQHSTTRLATPDCEPITAERVEAAIRKVFPDPAGVVIDEWMTAHADFTWANVTGPQLWILDWEDWGRAPRGLDAASLWFASLAVSEVADQVMRHRAADLTCRTGQVMMLLKCAELLAWADETEPLYAPAQQEANRLVDSLAAAP